MPSVPQAVLNFKELLSFCKSHGLILSRGCCLGLQVELELKLPPAVHGFRHTNHGVN
jgi:hypothetical protein